MGGVSYFVFVGVYLYVWRVCDCVSVCLQNIWKDIPPLNFMLVEAFPQTQGGNL